jgi:hypothetical protein
MTLRPTLSPDAVLERVGAFFMGTSPIHSAAREITRRLDEMGIDHAIAGALCLGAHGAIRATEDVDIVIRKADLDRFKATWIGRGYVDIRPGGKAIRDTVNNVKIDFLIAGDYPGDGKPKAVAFPDPATVAVEVGDLRVVALERFVELKLASGISAPHRLQDLADVLRLVEVRGLGRELADALDTSVRAKYLELWQAAQHPPDDY